MTSKIVQIRQRARKDGKIALYLCYTISGKRCYEYPKLYLYPETGRNKASIAASNKETMRVMQALQAKKIVELAQNRANLEVRAEPSKMLLFDYIQRYIEYKNENTRGIETINTIKSLKKHLSIFASADTRISDIDKVFCSNFFAYLKRANSSHGGKLSKNSIKIYYNKFRTMVKNIVKDGLLPSNPTINIDAAITKSETEREYLDLEEVKKMAATDTPHTLSKQAFMFSCFCGLRISDIRQLAWSDIEEYTSADGRKLYKLHRKMQKTQRNISYTLPQEAVRWLPDKNGKLVFEGLAAQCNLNVHVRRLAEAAGITKHISFHCAKHTFATMMLTLGADIYTTSKLLGHTRVATTEIYAKIVDKKKDEAMRLIDEFFDD